MDTVGWLAHLLLLGTEYINIINQSIGITVFWYFVGCNRVAIAMCSCLGITAFFCSSWDAV